MVEEELEGSANARFSEQMVVVQHAKQRRFQLGQLVDRRSHRVGRGTAWRGNAGRRSLVVSRMGIAQLD